MRKRIRQLDPILVNQIAAGEVIERPASVVKELLENAVDSGARNIDVEVRDGGVELISIVDDGCGMLPDDLPLAFSSHATSKLAKSEDLETIATLGFRGEALASIASVSQMTVQSRAEESEAGAELVCNGGELGRVTPWNGRPGTRVVVKHLFYNTPARRKFLKSTATEMGHISEAVIRIALGFPGIGIRLRHNERSVYTITPETPLNQRIQLLFGEEVGQKLLAVKMESGKITLNGYVADPAINRGNSRLQYFFVNGRCIRDRTLGHALSEAFHGLIMVGRYPVGFLFLNMPSELVDVNVHPAKAEVRFLDNQAVHHFVRTGVRTVLHRENLQPVARPHVMQQPLTAGSGNWKLSMPPITPQPRFSWPLPTSEGLPSRVMQPSGQVANVPIFATDTNQEVEATSSLPYSAPIVNAAVLPSIDGPDALNIQEPVSTTLPAETSTELFSLPHPKVLQTKPRVLQLHQAYLVIEESEGMLVVDQHALHERILYEQLKERIGSGAMETQGLLIPEPVELTPDQKALALHHQEALAHVGLPVQDFGGNTVLVAGVPSLLPRAKPDGLLRMVLEHFAASDNTPTAERLYDNLLRLMACHAAVKAGDKLSEDEMHALLAQRHDVEDSHHCPHGRPTSLFFSKMDLDKQFERI